MLRGLAVQGTARLPQTSRVLAAVWHTEASRSWLHTGSPRSPQGAPEQTKPPSKEAGGEQEILDLLSQSRLSQAEGANPLDGQQVGAVYVVAAQCLCMA